jgi:hypothetical protein
MEKNSNSGLLMGGSPQQSPSIRFLAVADRIFPVGV